MNPNTTRPKRRKAPPGGAHQYASKNLVKRQPVRTQAGAYLIELLAALVVATLVVASLFDVMAANYRLATETQNEIYSDNLISGLSNFTGSLSYDFLKNHEGSIVYLLQNGQDVTNPIHTTPVQPSDAKFPGDVTLKVDSGPSADQLIVTITVSWKDSSNIAGKTKGARIAVFKDINGAP